MTPSHQGPPPIQPLPPGGGRPFWSVMIPCYNPDPAYLEQTLRSVLVQDPGPDQMQIEVVDDGSPRPVSREFIQSVCGDRVLLHVEPRNLGLSGIWNRCIERARGEWLHILHQDDLVFPGFYSSLAAGISAHPRVGAAFTRYAHCDELGHWHMLAPLEMPAAGVIEDLAPFIATRECIQCAAITVRRATYEKLGGFHPGLRHALDWEMWMRIAAAFPFFYEPRILASWRHHDKATTSKQIHSGENTIDIARAISVWKQHLDPRRGEALAAKAGRGHAQGALHLAGYLARINEKKGFEAQLRGAMACNPSLETRFKILLLRMQFLVRPVIRAVRGNAQRG